MTAKNTSPEAEQKKLWKLEIKQMEAGSKKVARDVSAEFRRSRAEVKASNKAAWALEAKHVKLTAKLVKIEKRECGKYDRRIALLKGRLGI